MWVVEGGGEVREGMGGVLPCGARLNERGGDLCEAASGGGIAGYWRGVDEGRLEGFFA